MTTSEFFSLLSRVSDQFEWCLIEDRSHPLERRESPRLHLVGTAKSRASLSMSPLQAVCFALRGQLHPIESFLDAAAVLNMEPDDVRNILAAANDRTWKGAEGHRTPVEKLIEIRRQLLEAVGLKSVPADSTQQRT